MGIVNKYSAACHFCSSDVAAGAGQRLRVSESWVTSHEQCAAVVLPAPRTPLATPPDPVEGWHRGELAAFDLETTGCDPQTDRIVSASIYHSDGRSRQWLVDPGIEIPPDATKVHGITNEQVRAAGAPTREAVPEIAAALSDVAAVGTPLVAYNAAFDLTMLRRELHRLGAPELDWSALHVIDPMVLDRQADRYRRGKRRLVDVCAVYGVTLPEGEAHTSLGDARAALALAQALGERHAQLAEVPVAELHRAQVGWHADDCARLQRYFAQRGSAQVVDGRWPFQLDEPTP